MGRKYIIFRADLSSEDGAAAKNSNYPELAAGLAIAHFLC